MRITERYREYYDDFLRQTRFRDDEVYDWRPGVHNELIVYMNNGDVYSYNCMGHICRRIIDKSHGEESLSDDEIFVRRLKSIMEAKCMTQSQLAKKSDIALVTINKYLNGKLHPSHTNVMKLSRALDCTIMDLSYY